MAKANFKIETPRGRIIQHTVKSGQLEGRVIARLDWNEGFGPRKSQDFAKAQEFVDSECLRYMNPLTPRLSGAMIKSGTLGTAIGSGKIVYITPYARRQYYENKGQGERGRLWFERMKAQHKDDIRKGAENFAAGK